MCVQCMATASVAVGSASGIRAWDSLRRPGWLSGGQAKAVTAALLVAAILVSGVRV